MKPKEFVCQKRKVVQTPEKHKVLERRLQFFEKLSEKYPFITLCVYSSQEYVGIIQNRDDAITTIYDFGSIANLTEKQLFLEQTSMFL